MAARGARAAMAKTRVGIKSIQPRTSPIYAAFDQRLREPGYIEAQNLIVDFLNPEDQAEGIAGAIKELVRRKVDCHCAPLRTSVVVHLDAQPLKTIVPVRLEALPGGSKLTFLPCRGAAFGRPHSAATNQEQYGSVAFGSGIDGGV